MARRRTPSVPASPLVLTLLALLALFLVSCAPSSNSNTPSSTSNPPASASETSLTIEVKATPESNSSSSVLNCTGAKSLDGSTVKLADAACAALEKAGPGIFQAPITPQSCTMQMGGPQTAKVSGTFHGSVVEKTFDQHDGCAIAEWNQLAPLFGSDAADGKL
ncbi:hypothetical protein FHU41_002446 [Psychromicrobium silvestre]|uniref:Subtilisin inhibitor-like protein n=1 Tax=Psychromicrobium silvestre TaxID=1645614 RepID=A0A7Y9LV73_9MICC|nr:serine protease inhibitor [Psychromicrobium silvestre]NYE96196.1 hypothetical protein [Psychromicrobium silvestre]